MRTLEPLGRATGSRLLNGFAPMGESKKDEQEPVFSVLQPSVLQRSGRLSSNEAEAFSLRLFFKRG